MKKLLLLCIACFFTHIYTLAGFTNVVNSGTSITASKVGNWGEVVENLRDNNQGTKYSCFFNSTDEIYIQYELNDAVVLYKYGIRTANDSPGRDPLSWTLLGSNDASTWTTLDTRSNEFFSGRTYTNEYVVRANNTAYKYYRLLVSKIVNSDQLSFADWNLYTKDDSTLAPSSLKLSGSALTVPSEEVDLGWKNGYYELYTSLKAGNLTFVGDATLAGSTITGEDAVYRIRVDYRTNTPEVAVQKIEKVDLWTPWNGYTIGELKYVGNSKFSIQKILFNRSAWGDDRYRVRVFFEGNIKETYGTRSSTSEYLTLTHNEGWGVVGGLSEWNCHVPNQYTNETKYFNIEVGFEPTSVYQVQVSEYIPNTLPSSLSIEGIALPEASASPLAMKQNGSVFDLYTSLNSGTYSFVGDNNLSGNSIVVDGTSVPYRIRVSYEGETPSVTFKKIESVYMWVPWSGKTVGTLTYEGNSTFKAPNLICSTAEWSNTDWEDRHRIRIRFEGDVIETYGPKDGKNFVLVGNETWGASDFNYNVNDKYKNKNTPFVGIVNLSSTADYQYSQEDYTPVSIDETKSLAPAIYPTLVSDNLNISLSKAGFRAEIFSTTGKLVASYICSSNELKIDGLSLPAGVYLVKILQADEVIAVERIISK